MNKKIFIIMCLMAIACAQTVLKKNQCSDCAQFKSQIDCSNEQITDQCEWIAAQGTTSGKCQKKADVTNKSYCQQIDKPETNCAQKLGCAYVNGACIPFSGCSAYVKTSTQECQAISYFCVSDGTTCLEANECKNFTQAQCESSPSTSGIKKCKWNSTQNTCRDYLCSEADSSLTTDDQCKGWLAGCITKLKGCWTSPLPTCATYTQDANQCAYIGSDGYCDIDTTSTTNCKLRDCLSAPTTLITDDDCAKYQAGCITSGKGCFKATTMPLCSAYAGDVASCVGFIGTDGICEGDVGGTKCRARKCENGLFSTDDLCKNYQSQCVSNGKNCVASKLACSGYKGTTITCASYVGSDGNCKGTTTTDGPCTLKVCDEAPTTLTTNDDCNKYQTGCVSTGAGCLTKANQKSCTTYAGDATSCQKKVGSEGNCTWASGSNCIARTCDGAPSSLNTTTACANWFTNCVTTGAGCAASTTCDLSVKQVSCEGTTGCAWQQACTSNMGCSEFKKKSVCLANLARIETGRDDKNVAIYQVIQKCGWSDSTGCANLNCSYLTGTYYNNDANCQSQLTDCISNRVDKCITKFQCSELKGTKDTCLSYPGYCTNTSTTDITPCTTRVCTDNTDAKDNGTCQAFLPGCISNGAGCVSDETACTTMKGTQDTCNKLYAYFLTKKGLKTTQQCYNYTKATDQSTCMAKTCEAFDGVTDGTTCTSFSYNYEIDDTKAKSITCTYNGVDKCLNPNADGRSCTDYTGDAAFCEAALVGSKGIKYCFGTSTKGTCKLRECTDNKTAKSDQECDTFMTGCIYTSNGCSLRTTLCSASSGYTTKQAGVGAVDCKTYFGGVSASNTDDKVQCVKYDQCATRICAEKTNGNSQSDCMAYSSICRWAKSSYKCIDQTIDCAYSLSEAGLSSATDQQKFDYCSQITDSSGKSCGFTSGAQTCSKRSCEQASNSKLTSKPSCLTYIAGATPDTITCLLAGNVCYKPLDTCDYNNFDGATTDALKLTQCSLYKDTSNNSCSFVTGGTKCAGKTSCEVFYNIDTKTCNDAFNSQGQCQKSETTCVTMDTDCAKYKLQSSTNTNNTNICKSLKIVDDLSKIGQGTAKYSTCIYKSSTTCSPIGACSDIASALSQADCEKQFAGCHYFNSKCYAAGTCPTSIPSEMNTDTLKSLYCGSMYETSSSLYCKYDSVNKTCVAGTAADCSISISGTTWDNIKSTDATYNTAFCNAQTLKDRTAVCKFTSGSTCASGTCEDILSPQSQGDCDNHITGCVFYSNKCYSSAPGIAGADCVTTGKVPFATGLTAGTAAALTYCQLHKGCTYDQSSSPAATNCAKVGACSTYTSTDANYCSKKVDTNGNKCAFTAAATSCRDFDCYDITNPTSQIDCDSVALLKCSYYKGTCYNNDIGCAKIPTISSGQKQYCDGLSSKSKACTFITGSFCVDKADDCSKFDLSGFTGDKFAYCKTLQDKDGNSCTYFSGTVCAIIKECANYDGATAGAGPESGQEDQQCKLVKDSTATYPCIGNGNATKKCKAQACTDNDSSKDDCLTHAKGCVYIMTINKCIEGKVCTGYTPDGSDSATKQTWCESVTDTSGNKCAWDDVNSTCKTRSCSDVSYYTNAECSDYLITCKTDGTKCVDIKQTCEQFKGLSSYCDSLLDATGIDKCQQTSKALDKTSSACQPMTCYDYVDAKSQTDCQNFLQGTTPCSFRGGSGCIPRDAECSQYRGTKQTCEGFSYFSYRDTDKQKDIYISCSGDVKNTATSPCKDRECTDNTTATDNNTCDIYLTGCVTKNPGCISNTQLCTAYKGDQALCSTFMGNTGSQYCWNTPTATLTSNCTVKTCADINGTSNTACNDGMKPIPTINNPNPGPTCVYDGTGCILYNQKLCNTYYGNEVTCATFIASDGPCKSSTVGTIKGQCQQRVCTEAPNSFATDAECKNYHPSCLTTGYGCSKGALCASIVSSTSCQARVDCTWSQQCYSVLKYCSGYSGSNSTACVNAKPTNGKQCAWVESTSICRDQTCEDLPATYTTHDKCKAFSDTCTTTGAGCITRTQCNGYLNEKTCTAASVDKAATQRCGWQDNKCRPRICSDSSAITDDECNTFLAGCKTNGTGCVTASTCSDFISAPYCLLSASGPCLWVYNTCYNYDRCEDAVFKNHTSCQKFSPTCTSNGANCISITSCKLTLTKTACVLGTDGDCGWLPSGSCQKFGACSDANGATNDDCQAYGKSCYSDGKTCVTQGKCSEYQTLTACGNAGTDGICFWNTTTNTCKLKECADVQNGTYDACKNVNVSTSLCTTNGTNCIPFAACSSYVEAGCYFGNEGDCIFGLAVGATTGTKACRTKQCEDVTGGTSNTSCQNALTQKQCVSNGKNCIAKAGCSTYTVSTACNGGGSDGTKTADGTPISIQCAFTPKSDTDKVNGTCKTFQTCADANKDQTACSSNGSCKWNSDATGTSCVNHTCATYASGTDCKPLPSFDRTSYTICVASNGACLAADPGTMTDSKLCYTKSAYTYSWNESTNKCEGCLASSTPNNSNGTNNNGTTVNDTNTELGYTLSVISIALLGFIA